MFEVDGRIAGFVSVVGNEVWDTRRPESRESGCGARPEGHIAATHPYLKLEVFEANTIGRRFYDANGFRPVGEGFDDTTGFPIIRLRIDPWRS